MATRNQCLQSARGGDCVQEMRFSDPGFVVSAESVVEPVSCDPMTNPRGCECLSRDPELVFDYPFGVAEQGPGSTSYSGPFDAARRGPADAVLAHRVMAPVLANYSVREKPDLVLAGVRFAEGPQPGVGRAALSAVVRNLGLPTRPSERLDVVAEYWRRGRWGLVPDADPAAVFGLGRDARLDVAVPFPLPGSGAAGDFRLCVTPAAGETLVENNCSATVSLAAGPQWHALRLELSSDRAAAGSRVEAVARVRNLNRRRPAPRAVVSFFRHHVQDADAFVVAAAAPVLSLSRSQSGSFNWRTDHRVRVSAGSGVVYACVHPADRSAPDPRRPGAAADCRGVRLEGLE